MGKEDYAVHGATLKCSMGNKSTTLRISSNRKYKIQNKKVGTITDCAPGVNLFPMPATFGICKLYASVPPPGNLCTPIPAGPWQMPHMPKTISGFKPLLKGSKLFCTRAPGGVITVKNTGQKKCNNTPPKPKCVICGGDCHNDKFEISGTNERGNITDNLATALDVNLTSHIFYRNTEITDAIKEIIKGFGKSKVSKVNESRVLFKKIPDPIEGHHLITCEAVEGERWYNLFYAFGYDINCPQNGVLFPGDMFVACHFKVPLHMGGHGATFGLKEMEVFLSYVESVKMKIQHILDSFEAGDLCKPLEEEDIRNFHDDMLTTSESIFKKLIRFQWTITSDGKDYAPSSRIGCFNSCRTIGSKSEEMKRFYPNNIQAKNAREIATELSNNLNSLCPRYHTNDGCIGMLNWYKDCRYNKLDKIII